MPVRAESKRKVGQISFKTLDYFRNMFQIIILSQAVDPTSTQTRIGGKALLPDTITWPHNPKLEPLTLVASLPSHFINKESGYSLPANTFVSIFTTYNKSDYFLDVITYAGTEQELANIRAGYTRVLLHAE
jgi:uncharacterized protein YwqG